jgi:hypothetical protein
MKADARGGATGCACESGLSARCSWVEARWFQPTRGTASLLFFPFFVLFFSLFCVPNFNFKTKFKSELEFDHIVNA